MYKCTYIINDGRSMNYQWDVTKARSNYKKHRVKFSDAVSVFSDTWAITIEDEVRGEERFIVLGIDAFGRILVIVFTLRDKEIRIISARKATRKEIRQYEEKR
jgi:uncharacterized DUF497 family protein